MKETVTDKTKGDYNGRPEPVFDREYAVRDVTKTRERRVNLLTQEVEDGTKFDLPAVIAAINKRARAVRA